MRRIGALVAYAESDPEGQAGLTAFREVFQSLGWMDGRNARFNYRWTAGDASLVRGQTQIIPIMFASASDPVAAGLVAGLGHPSGDITGFTGFQYE